MTEVPLTIVICGSPRTGGNWLCSLLRQAGLGDGDEYLSMRVIRPLLQEWGISLDEYWSRLWKERTVNGNFVIKMHWLELRDPHTGGDPYACLPPGVHRFWIFQTRDQKSQAISWARAVRSGQWHGKAGDPLALDAKEAWRYEPLCRLERIRWEEWFNKNHIQPYRLPYETLLADPQEALGLLIKTIEIERALYA